MDRVRDSVVYITHILAPPDVSSVGGELEEGVDMDGESCVNGKGEEAEGLALEAWIVVALSDHLPVVTSI